MSEAIADRFAVQDVMLRYAASVDERDLGRYRDCFADDVEVHGFGESTFIGADAWTDYVKAALEPFGSTQHMLGPQLAELSGDQAHCRTDVQALHCMKEPEGEVFTLWATYITDMKRISGKWKITRHQLVPRATKREQIG